MIKTIIYPALLIIFISAIFNCNTSQSKKLAENDAKTSDRPVHWTYNESANWAKLSPTYNLCGTGTSQSPIDIDKSVVKEGITWELNYKPTSLRIAHNEHMDEIIDNGHTIQVTVDEGSNFTYGKKTYQLKQFHFHTPSEHTINGKNMPMEIHMVHQSDDGSLAVIGILFKIGPKANENLSKIIKHLPDKRGERKHLKEERIDLKINMPANNYTYHYTGSLTTPPCNENVQWLILSEMVSLSADQFKTISSRIGPNNRPVQPLNTRKIQLNDLKATVVTQ
ncbi:MAG: carbonic anhydrase family protein [Leptospiraceae bacterium]|nr:carbonic anhydrase family protein [Leptospiraceae bacterium]